MEWSELPRLTLYSCSQTVSWYDLEHQIGRLTEEYNLDLDPDFQRPHRWDKSKQVKYVEYILGGGQQSRDIILNHPGWLNTFDGQLILVDGKQRLQAVRSFLAGKIPAFGYLISEFTRNGKPSVKPPMQAALNFCITTLPTRNDVLRFYLELNSGGVAHTPSELRKVEEMLESEISRSSS